MTRRPGCRSVVAARVRIALPLAFAGTLLIQPRAISAEPPAGADERADVVVLTPEMLGRITALSKPWRFHPGDDPAWARPDCDDSAWPLVRPDLRDLGEAAGDWAGIGWFRRKVRLDPEVSNATVGVHVFQAGACEVYLDGRLAVRFGTVSADAAGERAVVAQVIDSVTLIPGVDHLLAVRYSNARGNVLLGGFRGFTLNVGDVQAMARWGMRLARVFTGLMGGAVGLFGAFAVLHLLLFLFQPTLRENFHFAVFNGAMVAVLATELWMNSLSDLADVRLAYNVEMTCMFAMVMAGLLLERRVFGRGIDAAFWVVAAAGIATLLWLWTRPALADAPVFAVFLVLGLLDMLRLAIAALLRREPDAWVVALGFAALTLGLLGTVLRNLVRLEVSPWPLFIGGMGALVLSFSVYLTRRVARTNRELARRLAEVEELTARTLEQEHTAREREVTRLVLEADNRRKTAELEEARRLQLAMLPQNLPELPGFELAVHMATANEVGGDYYDFLRGADGRWTVALGDATGHGLHAGMVVGVAKSLLQTADSEGDLGALLGRIDAGLATLHERRASMGLLLVRLNGDVLRVASAGMPPMLIRRSGSGDVEEILLPGVPLGTLAGASWHQRDVPIGPGDSILLMSDGLAEVSAADDTSFGYERVQRAFADAGALAPAAAVSSLLEAADAFRGDEPLRDDLTLVVLRARLVQV